MSRESISAESSVRPWRIDGPGDCRELMRALADESFDSCVTDPPYELGFMGKAWDASGVAFDPETWRQVLRVLKPGAHILAFGGTRTYHRMAAAIEDAGFEIRDSIHWMYGSGFPKSMNLEGAHDGWGTALKPSHEPIVLARKPFKATVEANVQKHGTGAINIDASRVQYVSNEDQAAAAAAAAAAAQRLCRDQNANRLAYGQFTNGDASLQPYLDKQGLGRWPPNVVLTHSADCQRAGRSDEAGIDSFHCAPGCPVAMLDKQSGELTSGQLLTHHKRSGESKLGTFNIRERTGEPCNFGGDTGGASRFFPTFEWAEEDFAPFYYCAKPAASERDAGLEHRARKRVTSKINRGNGTGERFDGGPTAQRANDHPTVKPIALMRWLCRLVTPKGGLVLEPFAGSGTTIIAALRENFRAHGIELHAHHIDLARDRIVGDAPLFNMEAVNG